MSDMPSPQPPSDGPSATDSGPATSPAFSSSLGSPSPMAVPAGAPGPVGKPRSVLLVILLSIVTFGIWTIVWSYQNGEEIKEHARTGLGGLAYLFITILI